MWYYNMSADGVGKTKFGALISSPSNGKLKLIEKFISMGSKMGNSCVYRIQVTTHSHRRGRFSISKKYGNEFAIFQKIDAGKFECSPLTLLHVEAFDWKIPTPFSFPNPPSKFGSEPAWFVSLTLASVPNLSFVPQCLCCSLKISQWVDHFISLLELACPFLLLPSIQSLTIRKFIVPKDRLELQWSLPCTVVSQLFSTVLYEP